MDSLSRQTNLGVILAILGGTFLAVVLLGRMQRGRGRWLARFLLWTMMLGYLAGFAWLTVLCREPQENWIAALEPFWSYREAFSFAGGLSIRRLGVARQILLNVCLCVPLGFLLPALADGMDRPWLATLSAGFALSAATEAIQYFSRRGLCETDDVINNVLGCLIGLTAWTIVNALLDAVGRRR